MSLSGQPAVAELVEAPEVGLRLGKALVGGELVKARRFLIVLC
jgi:hypothetical protein